MSNYNVIFEGKLSSGYRLQDVKRNLAALFKIDGEKVDILFSKSHVVLKKGLDYDSAMRYRQAILKTGAECNVRAADLPAGSHLNEQAIPPNPTSQALHQSGPPPISKQSSIRPAEDTETLHADQPDQTFSEKTPRQGFGDIIAGIVIIVIGFAFGGSVFLGNPGPLDYFFDGLGIFWIGRGIFKLIR